MDDEATAEVIFGLHGWYWATRTGNVAVVVTDYRLLNKHFNRYKDFKYPPGAEDTVYFTIEDFRSKKISRMLKVLSGTRNQSALSEYHDSKYSDTPKNPPAIP